jgi:threonine dehydrogenase-like Zn-dependent dehydrogenase
MKTLEYVGPWEMAMTDAADPAPGAGEVLIEVIATGICGSDVHGYTGETGRRVPGQVMGHETVGRVLAGGDLTAGTLVTVNPILSCGVCERCALGRTQVCAELRVLGVEPSLMGSFAELLVVPERNVIALPSTVSAIHGALIEPLAVGYHALMRAHPAAEDRLLIVGGGPIGQAAALAARRTGIEHVLVSEPTDSRRDLLGRLGFATTSPRELDIDVRRVLGGAATVVVDAVGVSRSFASALSNSTPRARVVLVGMGAREMVIEPYEITVGEREVFGSYCYSEDHFRSTAVWVGEGREELSALVDKTLPLADGDVAFRTAADSADGLKILLFSDPNLGV